MPYSCILVSKLYKENPIGTYVAIYFLNNISSIRILIKSIMYYIDMRLK